MASQWRWLKCVRCGQLDDTNQGSLPYGECRDCRDRYRKTRKTMRAKESRTPYGAARNSRFSA